MSQSCFSLGFLSQNSLCKLFTFCGYKSIYSRVREECEKTFFCKTRCSGDSLTTRISHKFESRDNCQARLSFLSYSVSTVVTLQFLVCFTCVACWRVVNRESLARTSLNSSHSLTHNPYMIPTNTRYLIAEIQANLAQTKPTHG